MEIDMIFSNKTLIYYHCAANNIHYKSVENIKRFMKANVKIANVCRLHMF